MGVEHSFRDDEGPRVMRCPSCEVISVVKAGEEVKNYGFLGISAALSGKYFICQNPKCDVERIYNTNCVITSK
jgi:hypothetical protein